MRSGDGSIRPSNADGSVTELLVRDSVSISWARVGCVLSLARSREGGDFPSDGVSLASILISSLSKRFRFFRAHEMFFGERPVGGLSLWSVFISVSFCVSEWLRALERFLVVFSERLSYFLHPEV